MPKIIRIFFWGLIISFLGSLPLGTLNVAAMQIGIQESIRDAMYFSLGSLLVEMIYVRVSLVGIDWVRKQQKLMKAMEWITLGIVLALAVGSFVAALKDGGETKNVMLQNNMHRFLLGMFMCAINPVQIPFWFGWSTVLFSKNIFWNPTGLNTIHTSSVSAWARWRGTVCSYSGGNGWCRKYLTVRNT
ncbi:MAG: LysE family transporter [Ferruginibacter sp.]